MSSLIFLNSYEFFIIHKSFKNLNYALVYQHTLTWCLILKFYGNYERCMYLMKNLCRLSAKQWDRENEIYSQNFFEIIDWLHSSGALKASTLDEDQSSNILLARGSFPLYFSKTVKDMLLMTIQANAYLKYLAKWYHIRIRILSI